MIKPSTCVSLQLHLDTRGLCFFIMLTDQFSQLVKAIVAGEQTVSGAADELHSESSQREKIGLLDGDAMLAQWLTESLRDGHCGRPVVVGAVAKIRLPGMRFSDGPRGMNMGTCFPRPRQELIHSMTTLRSRL